MIQRYPRVRFECGPDFSFFFKGPKARFLWNPNSSLRHNRTSFVKENLCAASCSYSQCMTNSQTWVTFFSQWNLQNINYKPLIVFDCFTWWGILLEVGQFKSRPIEHGFQSLVWICRIQVYFLKTALWTKRMKRSRSCPSCCFSSMCPSSWWPPMTMSHICMYCKHFIFCSISICPSSWWPPSAIRPQAYIANVSSLDPVKMWLRIKTQMENIAFSDGHEAMLLTSYNHHHTKLHFCVFLSDPSPIIGYACQ